MQLYEMIKNISGNNNEEELKDAINITKNNLENLIEQRTCKIYSGLLYKELLKKHVPARIINTKDLGFSYEHEFVLVPDNISGYFLADLTFSQFNRINENLLDLLLNGYKKLDSEFLNDYFKVVVGNDTNLNIDDIYYDCKRK